MGRRFTAGLAAVLLPVLASCASPGARVIEAPAARADGATVVLVHGLGRRSRSLLGIGKMLSARGYRVCRIDYPSLSEPPDALVARFGRDVTQCGEVGPQLHFVTHSLGGIVLRAWLRENPSLRVGRVVMLAPPNHGTELADVASRSMFLSAVLGPTAVQMGTDPTSFPRRLGPASFALGIIAGDRSVHPLGTFLLEGTNDGTVTQTSARLAGMRDFATVHRAHSFIMNAPEVIGEVGVFLATGCFSRELDVVSYDEAAECARAPSLGVDGASP